MRYWYGQSPTDWTMVLGSTVQEGGVTYAPAQAAGPIAVTMWSAPSGGTQYTDLLDASGSPIAAVTSSDGSGSVPLGMMPAFQAPDGVAEVWADAGGGVRYRMVGSLAADVLDLLERVEGLENAVTNLQALAAAQPVTVLYDEGAGAWPERPVIAGARVVFWFGPNSSPPPSGRMATNDQFFGWAS